MNVANKVNSKGDALNALAKNGVSSDIVTKVNGYLNNPMAGFIAKAAGVDLNKVKNIVGDLQGSGGTVQPDINQGQQLHLRIFEYNNKFYSLYRNGNNKDVA